jgi:pectate lyase-like protein
MTSQTGPNGGSSTSIESLREDTRRSMLAKVGLVAGGVGTAALVRSQPAVALPTADDLKFDGYNNIKDFGASTSASAATNRASIQQCIDASAGQAAVYIPPGTFLIDQKLEVPSETVMVGVGSQSVIKASGFSGTQGMIVPKAPTANDVITDIRIENLKIDGNKQSGSPLYSLIAMRRTDSNSSYMERIVVRGVELKNIPGFTGAYFQNVRVGRIQNCHVHHGDSAGIQIQGLCQDVLIQDNIVHDFFDDCIAVTSAVESNGGPVRTSVVGNIALAPDQSSGGGIAVDAANEVLIAGNICYRGRHAGIDIRAAQGFSVRDIEIVDNVVIEGGRSSTHQSGQADTGHQGGRGIYLWLDSQYNLSHISVRDNLITTPRYQGIGLVQRGSNVGSFSDITVSGNKIWVDPQASGLEGTGHGISLESPNNEAMRDIRITDNDIYGTNGSGINVEGKSLLEPIRRCDIQGNRVEKAGTGTSGAHRRGIYLDNVTDTTVSNNRTYDIQTSNVDEDHIAIRRGTRASVSGNSVDATTASAGSCISVKGTSEVVVTGNVLRGGALGGVRVETSDGQSSRRVVINDNLILESGNCNISGAQGNYSDNFGIGVLLRSNGESGAPKLEDIKITDNVITQFRKYGVWPDASSGSGGITDVQIVNNSIAITNAAASHLNQLGQGIRCVSPAADVVWITINDNRIRDMFEDGIRLVGGSASPGLLQNIYMRDNTIDSSGKSTTDQSPGIYTSVVAHQVIRGNRSYGPTQSYGIHVDSPRGDVQVEHNNCIGSAVMFNFSGSTAALTRIRVKDNLAFNPWTGNIAPPGPWVALGDGVSTRTVAVIFAVPFITGTKPRILVSTDQPGVGASAVNVTNVGFTATCWTYQSMPVTNPVIYWQAEPSGLR